MKIKGTTWFYIAAAFITLYGIVTRNFLFIILAFPVGLFGLTGKDKDDNEKR
ncbi:MAG: hypothetical protein ACQESK_03860 [Bacteroidota bacterium]